MNIFATFGYDPGTANLLNGVKEAANREFGVPGISTPRSTSGACHARRNGTK
jgi:hypothetical protein